MAAVRKDNVFQAKGRRTAEEGQAMEEQKKMGKKRMANVELLRICSMLMIVLMHLLNHGKVLETVEKGSVSYYLTWTIFGISFVSISCYILISGYFLCEASFSFVRLLRLEGQVWFYSAALFIAAAVVLRQPLDMSSLIAAVFPILSCEYWFVTMYAGMLILSPFLNKLLLGLSRKQFRLLLGFLFVLFSLWPNVFFFSPALNFGGGSGVVWFVTVYLFGAYLKRFYVPDGRTARHFLHFLAAGLLIPASRFVIELLLATPLGKIGFLQDLMWGYSLFYQYNSVLVLAAALLVFIAFLNLEIRPGRLQRLILAAAPLSFGVYLLHDNPNWRGTLWEWINPSQMADKWYLVPGVLVLAAGIFLICALLEMLRKTAAGLPGRLRRNKEGGRKQGWLERKALKLDKKLLRENEM